MFSRGASVALHRAIHAKLQFDDADLLRISARRSKLPERWSTMTAAMGRLRLFVRAPPANSSLEVAL